MKRQVCKYCGAIMQGKGRFCPSCGKKKKRNPIISIFIILIGMIFLFISISLLSSEPKSQPVSQVVNTPSYESEITYQGTAWGASAVDVLGDYKYVSESLSPTWSDTSDFPPIGSVVAGYAAIEFPSDTMGGYPIRQRNTYYLFGHDSEGNITTGAENSELYLVYITLDVVDVIGTSDDLQTKLTNLYGEGTTSTTVITTYSTSCGTFKSDLTITEWIGQNNTAVRLITSVPQNDAPSEADSYKLYCVLAYGKTDSATTINSIYKEYKTYLSDQESVSRDSSDKGGL